MAVVVERIMPLLPYLAGASNYPIDLWHVVGVEYLIWQQLDSQLPLQILIWYDKGSTLARDEISSLVATEVPHSLI